MHILVTDKTNRTAGKRRHARQLHGLVAGHLGLDDFEWIFRRFERFDLAAFVRDRDFVFEHANDLAWIAAEKRKAADALTADDRFEQKGGAVCAYLGVGTQRRLAVCSQVEVHRHGVTLFGECFKFRSGRLDVHRHLER